MYRLTYPVMDEAKTKVYNPDSKISLVTETDPPGDQSDGPDVGGGEIAEYPLEEQGVGQHGPPTVLTSHLLLLIDNSYLFFIAG